MHSSDSSIDLGLLRIVARKRRRVWIPISVITLSVSLAYTLFVMPQTYTSRVSISFPQATQPGVLGSLIGVTGSGNNKYLGIVKSARLARVVEQKADVQDLLHLSSHGDGVQVIRDGLIVDDNPRDGLMYISVQLPGPPRFAFGAAAQREKTRQTVTVAAATYADALRRYLAVADVDKESILFRASEERLRKERHNYDLAVESLVNFVRRSWVPQGDAGPAQSASSSSTSSVTGMQSSSQSGSGGGIQPGRMIQLTALEQLYSRRAQLEADVRSAMAALDTADEQRREMVENVDSVPLEDPFLAQTRNALQEKKVELESAQVQFGPDHPSVINLRKQVDILSSQFEQQRRAAMSGRSSMRADAEARLSALNAALATVVKNISKAERGAHVASKAQADYQILHNNVDIALETLKAVATNSAILQIQTLSSKNRMTVVDDARPPRAGAPGLFTLLLGSAFVTTLVVTAVAALDYSRYNRSLEALDPVRAKVSA
jgi:hypothetical protein